MQMVQMLKRFEIFTMKVWREKIITECVTYREKRLPCGIGPSPLQLPIHVALIRT